MEKKKRVLLIDDDPLIIQSYQTELELSDFSVLKAGDGQTGLVLARTEKPDVILLDVLMPILNGIEVLRKIKEDPETSSIPVLILTNIGQDQAVKEAMGKGARDFILKYRFSTAEVIAKIREAL